MSKGKSGDKRAAPALERSASHLLHRAVQLALDVYSDEFGAGAITQRQYAVLAAAADREGATQTDLVHATGIDRSTMADMVARLIAKGLLERERSQLDARANAVRLTEAGHAVLAEARPKMAAADARLLKHIAGGGRRQAFVGLLRDLVESAEAAPAKAEAKLAAELERKKRKDAKVVAIDPRTDRLKPGPKKKKKAKKAA